MVRVARKTHLPPPLLRYTYPNGDTYEGDWVGGLKEGQGVYTYEETGVKVTFTSMS